MSCGLLTGGRFNLPFISLPLIKPGPCMASPIHMQNITFACSQLDLLRPDWSKPLGPGTHICLQITWANGSSGDTLVPQQRLDLASNLKQWSVRIIELICIHWLSLSALICLRCSQDTESAVPVLLPLSGSDLTGLHMCIHLVSHYMRCAARTLTLENCILCV